MKRIRVYNRFLFVLLGVMIAIPSLVDAQSTEVVSVSTSGIQGNGASSAAAVSADGRYVAFESYAGNLIQGDILGTLDIFVKDRITGVVSIASVNSSGIKANGTSTFPSISADGRFVAFESYATNLAPSDANATADIFVRDMVNGVTELVSRTSSGTAGNSASRGPSISAEGRFVAFYSLANNLVSGDTNGTWDVFIYDRATGRTERASVNTSAAQGNNPSMNPMLSGDGRFVAFESTATTLVTGDTNGVSDIFVHDRSSGVTERVSIDNNGIQGSAYSSNPGISTDGRYIVFASAAANLVLGDSNGMQDVFVRDRDAGITERISVSSGGVQGNRASNSPSISQDGRYVVFESNATNLVLGDSNGMQDVFVRDRDAGITERVSVSSDGVQGNGASSSPSISQDGRYAAFGSPATNLVSSDTNGVQDVFVRDRGPVNNPPVADAGPDQRVSCSGPAGSDVILDGSISSDPDRDELTYTWTGPFGIASGLNPRVEIPLGTYLISLKVEDGKGGTGTDTVTVTVEDATPPSTTVSIGSGAASLAATGTGDWYKADVIINLLATDNCVGCEKIYTVLDGVSSVTADSSKRIVISKEGIHELSFWSSDRSGNTEQRQSATVKVDRTPPTITTLVRPAPNAQGWNSTDVTVTFVCKDSLSGIASCPLPVKVTNDGAGQVITGQAVDNAGNSETVSVAVSIDKTPPAITAAISPEPNAQGWNNTDATVTFTCSDTGSGIIACPSPVKVTTEGAGQVISGEAVNYAGDSAVVCVTLNIDKTPPVISISTDPRFLWPANGKMVNVSVRGNVSDASQVRSIVVGVKDEYGTVQPSLDRLNTTISLEARRDGNDRDGRHYTIEAVAIDIAGNNSSATTEVIVPHDMGK